MDIKVAGYIVRNDDKWIYDWYEVESFCPNDLTKAINTANGEDLTLLISSPGGDVESASEIRSMLKAYKGNTRSIITGIAASAASVIMTGTKITDAYVTAVIMVHQASTVAAGNAQDFKSAVNMLNEYDLSIANAYAEKTGSPVNECLEMMKDVTYMSVQTAKEKGLIDNIISESPIFQNSVTNTFKFSITNKMREIATSAKNNVKINNSLQKTGNMPNEIDVDSIANKIIEKMNASIKEQEAPRNQLKIDLLKDLDQYGK